jgi:cytochrome c oxidase subunit 2
MIKLALVLAVLGLGLVLASFAPWRAGAPPGDSHPAAPTPADAAYGRALFLAKGCAQCHRHAEVAHSGDFGGMWNAPDLSTYRWDEGYLRKWLKDPSAVKPGTNMPTLGLNDDEIAALIAFLKTGRGAEG